MAKKPKELKIERQEENKYRVTLPDGVKENIKARYFRIFNGDITFYDKMNKVVANYSSDATIEVD